MMDRERSLLFLRIVTVCSDSFQRDSRQLGMVLANVPVSGRARHWCRAADLAAYAPRRQQRAIAYPSCLVQHCMAKKPGQESVCFFLLKLLAGLSVCGWLPMLSSPCGVACVVAALLGFGVVESVAATFFITTSLVFSSTTFTSCYLAQPSAPHTTSWCLLLSRGIDVIYQHVFLLRFC